MTKIAPPPCLPLQEVASNHAVAMWGRSEEGFASDPSLAEDGLIFVMTRLQLQMDAYPRWCAALPRCAALRVLCLHAAHAKEQAVAAWPAGRGEVDR